MVPHYDMLKSSHNLQEADDLYFILFIRVIYSRAAGQIPRNSPLNIKALFRVALIIFRKQMDAPARGQDHKRFDLPGAGSFCDPANRRGQPENAQETRKRGFDHHITLFTSFIKSRLSGSDGLVFLNNDSMFSQHGTLENFLQLFRIFFPSHHHKRIVRLDSSLR